MEDSDSQERKINIDYGTKKSTYYSTGIQCEVARRPLRRLSSSQILAWIQSLDYMYLAHKHLFETPNATYQKPVSHLEFCYCQGSSQDERNRLPMGWDVNHHQIAVKIIKITRPRGGYPEEWKPSFSSNSASDYFQQPQPPLPLC